MRKSFGGRWKSGADSPDAMQLFFAVHRFPQFSHLYIVAEFAVRLSFTAPLTSYCFTRMNWSVALFANSKTTVPVRHAMNGGV